MYIHNYSYLLVFYNYFRIILEAAFSLYDRTFLQNLGSILIFSVIVSKFFHFFFLIVTTCTILYFMQPSSPSSNMHAIGLKQSYGFLSFNNHIILKVEVTS